MKEMTMPPVLDVQEESKTRTLLPPYIPPRWEDTPIVKIPNKIRAPLVAPKMPQGTKVLQNIMQNLQKLSFDDYDMNKLKDLDR